MCYFCQTRKNNDRTHCKYGWTVFDTGFFAAGGGGGGGEGVSSIAHSLDRGFFFVGREGGEHMYLWHELYDEC